MCVPMYACVRVNVYVCVYVCDVYFVCVYVYNSSTRPLFPSLHDLCRFARGPRPRPPLYMTVGPLRPKRHGPANTYRYHKMYIFFGERAAFGMAS